MTPSTSAKIVTAAAQYGVPPDLALRVATQESGGRQAAVSSAGAIGVMQLMPATAAGLGVDPYNEDANIAGGMKYLSQMYGRYGDWNDAVAAYNAGPGTIDKVLAGLRDLPAETVNYLSRILGVSSLDEGSDVFYTSGASDTYDDSAALSGSAPWVLAAAAAGGVAVLWLALRR
jgi:soluble lytic murein transglycosylase-like protein